VVPWLGKTISVNGNGGECRFFVCLFVENFSLSFVGLLTAVTTTSVDRKRSFTGTRDNPGYVFNDISRN
jgi:hypothetical protein